MNDQAGLTAWNALLDGALKLPGVRVDREKFLRAVLAPRCSAADVERAIQATPAQAGIGAEAIREAAEGTIKWHRAGVTAVSAVAGVPGGWWVLGAVPADLAQYFWHVVVMLQKLAYLHGWPELIAADGKLDDETKLVVTLFVGVMMGAEGASEAVGKLSAALASQVVKRLPRAAATKYALYRVAKGVATWLGLSLTKKKFAELVGRSIPLVGGVVSGSLTWMAFGQGATRLRRHLEGLPLARASAPAG
jgi:hypothetical protein